MDKKEYLAMSAVFALTLLITGTVGGLILNLIGFDVSITSWRYWVGMTALFVPALVPMVLTCNKIALDSTLGSALHLGSVCIGAFIFSSFTQQKPMDIWQFLIWFLNFAVVFICIQFILPHPWTQARIQSIKGYFSRK